MTCLPGNLSGSTPSACVASSRRAFHADLCEVMDYMPFAVEHGAWCRPAPGAVGASCAASELPTGVDLGSQGVLKASDSSVPATDPSPRASSPSASPSAVFCLLSPGPQLTQQCPGRTVFLLSVTCDQSHLQLISTGCVSDPCPWLALTTPAHSHLMGSAPAWQPPSSLPSHD